MKTCATDKTITSQAVAGNLFFPVPDTDFHFIEKITKVGKNRLQIAGWPVIVF